MLCGQFGSWAALFLTEISFFTIPLRNQGHSWLGISGGGNLSLMIGAVINTIGDSNLGTRKTFGDEKILRIDVPKLESAF